MAYWNECHMDAHVSVSTTSVSQVTGVEILKVVQSVGAEWKSH